MRARSKIGPRLWARVDEMGNLWRSESRGALQMSAESAGQTRLMRTESESKIVPAWFPRGDKIAFTHCTVIVFPDALRDLDGQSGRHR